jgi:hypothetical protein
MSIPEKQAPGRAEWGDKFVCGPCRSPDPDHSFQHIDMEPSGFSGGQRRVNDRRAGLCSECGHVCYEEDPEIICSVCGLVQEWGEPTPEDSMRLMFARFDLSERCMGLSQPIRQPGGDGGKGFLATRRIHYYKSIDGQNKTIECSVLDRARGYHHDTGERMPDELSYPELCIATFYDIPDIENPPMPAPTESCIIYHPEYTDNELAKINAMVNEKHGTMYPFSEKTIKKHREQATGKHGTVPYCHQIYEGTPIENLLKDHPKPGRAALNSLFSYFMRFFFEGRKYCIWPREPTRENIIKVFQYISPAGVAFAKEDLAEKRFDLLVAYGIIKGLEGYKNKKEKLYYATQKSGPHQMPTEPHTDTRKRYILNNQS